MSKYNRNLHLNLISDIVAVPEIAPSAVIDWRSDKADTQSIISERIVLL